MTTMHETSALLLDHPIGRRGRVAIRLASAEIRIVGEDGDRATVRTPDGGGLPDRVILETEEGALTIREQEALGTPFGSGRRTIRLEVGVPNAAEVAVDTASGSVDTRGLRGEQRYRTASGDLRVIEAAGRIDVNAVSGDAILELAGRVELGIRTVSGDVRVDGGSLDVVRVQTTSGDIRLDSPLTGKTGNTIETLSGDVSVLATAGIRVEARTVSGDLTSELPHKSEGRAGRRTLVIGDGAIELSFRSVSGDLLIHDGSRSKGRRGKAEVPFPATPPMPPMPPMPAIPPVPPTLSRVDEIEDGPVASRDEDPALEPRGNDAAAPDAPDAPDAADDERLSVLRALERGELDVATAMDRLAELDARDEGEAADD
jgi:hypothetical protein